MEKVVTKMRIYNYLTKQGIYPKNVRADYKDKKKLVWIYEDTEDLNNKINDFYELESDTRNENNGEDLFVVTFPMEKSFFDKWGLDPAFVRADLNDPKKKVWMYQKTPAFNLVLEHYNKLTLNEDGTRRTYWCCKRSRMKDYLDKLEFEPALATYDENRYHIWYYEDTEEFQKAKNEYFAQFAR